MESLHPSGSQDYPHLCLEQDVASLLLSKAFEPHSDVSTSTLQGAWALRRLGILVDRRKL